MKIKFLKAYQHKRFKFKQGQEVDIHVDFATKLIINKVAVPALVKKVTTETIKQEK